MFTKKTQAILSAVLTVLMVLSLTAGFVFPAFAEEEAAAPAGLADRSALPDIAGGLQDGVLQYKVTDRAGMEKLSALCAAGNLEGYSFFQAADIDMEGIPFAGIGTNRPAADVYTVRGEPVEVAWDWNYAFAGSFDGNGFVIKNLFLQGPSASEANGLFNAASGGVFKNIGIAGGLVIGAGETAALIGEADGVTVINCWNAATVIGQGKGDNGGVAGLIAEAYGTYTTIANSYNLGMIVSTGTPVAAGICAHLETGVMKNCYNAGELIAGFREARVTANRLIGFNALYAASPDSTVGAANNYYRAGCGQYSYKDANAAGLTALDDGAAGKTEAEFASLASALNGGAESPDALGGVDGYTVEFVNTGEGYPVLAYKEGGEAAVKRLPAGNAENVAKTDDWSEKSPLFARLKNNRGVADGTGEMRTGNLTLPAVQISTPLDLIVLGAFTYKNTSFGIKTVEFLADLDMSENVIPYAVQIYSELIYVPDLITVEGNRHIIYNWKVRSTTYYDAYAKGGVFGIISGDINDLGMIGAYTEMDWHPVSARYAPGELYTYPALMAGREIHVDTAFTNCFATGEIHILNSAAANANRNGGVLSFTNGGFMARNCWSDALVYNDFSGGCVPARAVGGGLSLGEDSLKTAFYLNRTALTPTIIESEISSYDVQPALNIDDPYLLAYTLYSGMDGAYWRADGSNVVFADSSTQTRKLTVTVPGERTDVYYGNPGDQLDLNTLFTEDVQFEVVSGDPFSLKNGVFTFPATDIAINARYAGVSFTHIQTVYDKYASYDPDLFTDGSDLAMIVELAEYLLENRDAVTVDDMAFLDSLADELTLTVKNQYPYLIPYALKDTVYAGMNADNKYAIGTKEDWLALSAAGGDFSGCSLHFTKDVDMENVPMRPLAFGGQFLGEIDGHGFVLKNILIDVELSGKNTIAPVGLVGYLAGTIRNLGIESGAVSVLYDTAADSFGVGAFAGVSSGDLIFCWNGADVTVRVNDVYDYNWNASVSGLTGRSGADTGSIVNCYNIGTVTAPDAPGKKTHAAAFNDWTYSIKIYNSFNYGTLIANDGGRRLARVSEVKSPDFSNIADVSGTADTLVNANATGTTVSLDPAAYASGELAWTLNRNADPEKGPAPYYTVRDGKTVFGTPENKTCRIVIKAQEQSDAVYYWNAGTAHEIDLPEGASLTVTEGAASVAGNTVTVSGDAVITVSEANADMRYARELIERYGALDPDLFTDPAGIEELLEAAEAVLAQGEGAPAEAYDALRAAESALQLTLRNEYPALVPFALRDTVYGDFPTDVYAVSSKEDWLAAAAAEGDFSGCALHFTNDVDMENTAMKPLAFGRRFQGEIDGHGFVLKNILIDVELSAGNTIAPVGLVGYLAGTIRNLGIESGAVSVLYDTAADSFGVGAFAGVSSGDLIFCWNGADVTVRVNDVYDYNWNASVSGLTGRSGADTGSIVNCYNIGTVTAPDAPGKKTHAAAFNDWTYSIKIYNSFNYGTLIANEGGRRLARVSEVKSPDFSNIADVSGTADTLVNANATGTTVSLDPAAYASGELAWTLNQNADPEKGPAPYYTVRDGKTVFGTAGSQSRKVTFSAGSSRFALYTDHNGKLIGLTDAILEEASWDYAGDLADAVFTEDAFITGTVCPHNWNYAYALNGNHIKTCTICGKSFEEACTVVYTYDGGNTHTHSGACSFCGNRAVNGEPCNENNTAVDPATHTEAEIIRHACSVCGHKYNEEGAPALGHTWSAAWVHQNTTSGPDSWHMKICTANDGGEIYEPCTFADTVVAPTYLEDGYTRHTCVVCGYYYDTDPVPMLTDTALILTGGRVKAGRTVTVPLAIANNPGIAGMTVELTFDTSALELVRAEPLRSGLIVSGPTDGAPHVRVSFASDQNVVSGGRENLLNLTFRVSDTAEEGDYRIAAAVVEAVSVSGTVPETYEPVDVVGGEATVAVYTYAWGDADRDTETTVQDAILILRYLIGANAEINAAAADANLDGSITLDDAVYLLRYLAGFEPALD